MWWRRLESAWRSSGEEERERGAGASAEGMLVGDGVGWWGIWRVYVRLERSGVAQGE